jgi:ankyrin repeat protein
MSKGFAILDENKGPIQNIFEAAERGNVHYITNYVQRNISADVNQRDKLMRTPLHWASELGQIACAEVLMDYGADIAITECNGRTPLHLAARSGDTAMLKLLLEDCTKLKASDHVNKVDHHGITPLFLALQRGDKDGQEAFEFLMMNGGKYGETQIAA